VRICLPGRAPIQVSHPAIYDERCCNYRLQRSLQCLALTLHRCGTKALLLQSVMHQR
jgi:hypothetical protein